MRTYLRHKLRPMLKRMWHTWDRCRCHGLKKYSMLVQSAVFTPGMYSLAHHHSGVEAVYVIDGEACYETPTRAAKLRKGETLALPGGTQMRAVVTRSKPRHVLAVIVHDAAQPATMRIKEGTAQRLLHVSQSYP